MTKVVNVYEVESFTEDSKTKILCKESSMVKVPSVFEAPLRHDLLLRIHDLMRKNSRQAYAVSKRAGHKTSAESWGTGRAVARIPRVRGGGTGRSGQGAFGNMCRGGHMFAPNKIWRKWHHRIPIQQRRYAMVTAIAATGHTNLVLNRGHLIEKVPQLPLVISDKYESIKKTKEAKKVMIGCGLWDDCEKAKNSKTMRAGIGKMRNRRFKQKKGPLVVYKSDNGITRAFRNIPGVTLINVNHLNVLKLAPGGMIGRATMWTKSAFEALEDIYGSQIKSSKTKADFVLPRSLLTNDSFQDIINSESIQEVLKARNMKPQLRSSVVKKNPLKNKGAMHKLNPYAAVQRKLAKRKLEQGNEVPAKTVKA